MNLVRFLFIRFERKLIDRVGSVLKRPVLRSSVLDFGTGPDRS